MGISLEEFRRLQAEGDEGELPVSGLSVRLRRVGMLELVERGDVPVTLKPLMLRAMNEGTKAAQDNLEEWVKVVNLVAGACLVAPAGLLAEELPFADRMAIVLWANEGMQKVQPFRAKQKGDVAAA